MYALPYEYYSKYGIRNYGFHERATSSFRAKEAKLAGLDINNSKIITCHIATAVR